MIQGFDITCLTSLREGLPRVFPESMAAGKPIVANNVDGAKEAIKDGINGYILPVNTPERMAARINYLLDNPKVRKQMGKNAREMVEKFSLEKMLKDLDELYHKLRKSQSKNKK